MAGDAERFMRDPDALAWNMEHDPGLRSTIVAVTWLDARPDPDVLSARLERATRLAPRFRRRAVPSPGGLATPQWVDCPFDLSLHLRRFEAPAPYTPSTVLEFARTEAMTAFDPSRPLWALTVIEGLEGDRAAMVMKVHHSLTDGVGGFQLAMLVFDTTPDPDPAGVVPLPETAPAPTGVGLARDALGHSLGRVVGTAWSGITGVVPVARSVARHPLRSVFDALATASSLGRFVAPVSDTLSPIMTARGLDRHLDRFDVDLADLKRAGAVVGGTMNDAFVASVTGGLRRYHEQHGAPVDALRVTMPISLRTADDPEGGNRITLERFVVPVGETDAAARVRMTGWACRAARYEEALPLSEAVAGLLNLLPTGVVGSMLKHVDFLASDVPGITVPVYLAGAPVHGYHAFGPTTGAAVNVTLVSYRGTCGVGCTIDTAAVPDPEKLMACLRDGFDEVLALGGPHRPVLPPGDARAS
jgi:diacylglycerol O-acyltransferase / wax synthase